MTSVFTERIWTETHREERYVTKIGMMQLQVKEDQATSNHQQVKRGKEGSSPTAFK